MLVDILAVNRIEEWTVSGKVWRTNTEPMSTCA